MSPGGGLLKVAKLVVVASALDMTFDRVGRKVRRTHLAVPLADFQIIDKVLLVRGRCQQFDVLVLQLLAPGVRFALHVRFEVLGRIASCVTQLAAERRFLLSVALIGCAHLLHVRVERDEHAAVVG